jgi:hypothetical protein
VQAIGAAPMDGRRSSGAAFVTARPAVGSLPAFARPSGRCSSVLAHVPKPVASVDEYLERKEYADRRYTEWNVETNRTDHSRKYGSSLPNSAANAHSRSVGSRSTTPKGPSPTPCPSDATTPRTATA